MITKTRMAPLMALAVGLAIALPLQCFAAGASERLAAELKKKFPNTDFSRVSETGVPEMFEVWMGDNVAYVSSRNPRYFVLGRMFDTETLKDVTGVKATRATNNGGAAPTADVRALPVGDAIKTVHGNGARTLYVFSDPACPYCRKLERELGSLKDVTIYTFLLPFQGKDLPLSIWCSGNRSQAWEQFMTSSDRSLLGSTNCAHPLDRNLGLANRLGVAATPTVFFGDGSRIDGYLDSVELEAQFKAAANSSASMATVSKE